MGLDTSHDCWHGAYSAFGRWRNMLAEAAGYTTRKDGPYEITDLDWGCVQSVIGDNLLGKWPAMPVRPDGTPDPLIILIAHSDCEGELQPEFLAPLADRLEGLLPKLEGLDGGGHVGNCVEKTRTFIAGLRLAACRNEPVTFH